MTGQSLLERLRRNVHDSWIRTAWGGKPRVIGWVEGRYRSQIRGWAMSPRRPLSRLTVDVVDFSGSVIARVLADRYRADVASAGFGDGYYGFAVSFSRLEGAGNPRFICTELGEELKGTAGYDTPAGKGLDLECSTLLMHKDPSNGGHLAGWILDRQKPDERRQLRLHGRDGLIVQQRATLFRPDCLPVGGDGFHGFYLPLPTGEHHFLLEDTATGISFRIS